jgi:TonB family protein
MNPTKLVLTLTAILLLGCAAASQSNSSESPAVISAVTPMYPPIARSANATGDVFVDVEINREGKVSGVESKNAPVLLRKVCEEAARRWLFSPAPNGDKKRKARLTFSFRIMPEKTPYYEGTPVYYPPYKIEVRTIAPSLLGP